VGAEVLYAGFSRDVPLLLPLLPPDRDVLLSWVAFVVVRCLFIGDACEPVLLVRDCTYGRPPG
jgi:hypothetical protein